MSPRNKLRFCAVAALAVTVLIFSLQAVQVHYGTAAAVGLFLAINSLPFALAKNPYALGLRLPLQLDEFQGVGVNQKGALAVTLGYAYHDILVNCQTGGVDMTVAQIKSMIDSITIELNGKPIQEWTPTSLDIANSTNGAQYAMANGYFRLYFSEPWNRTMEGEERGAWGTQGLDSFTIKIKTNGTAVAPSFKAYGSVEDGTNRPVRAYPIRHVRNYTAQPVAAAVTQWPTVLREVGLFYRRIHFLSALITAVEVRVQKAAKWDNIPRAVVAELMAKRGLALQANTYTVAFDAGSLQLSDQLASFLSTNPPVIVPDFLIKYTGSGAGTVDIVTEQYQLLP